MNTLQLDRLLKSKREIDKNFKGVYAIDTFPSKWNHSELPASFVINLDKQHQPGSHWVSVYLSTTNINEYFDSYGLRPKDKAIKSLLGPNYIYNASQLQSFLSTVCGQYSVFYIWKKSCGWTLQDIVNKFSDDCLANDIIVNTIIERHFDVDLSVFDSSFINTQIAKKYVSNTRTNLTLFR
jgi:hypothetical protein